VNRLLLDQGLPRSAVALLAQAGWDAVHVGDIGMSRAADHEILQLARDEGRVCVTLDADFHSLLATGGQSDPCAIRIRQQGLDAAALAALLQQIWPGVQDALQAGAMVTITQRSVRVRRLPIVRA
jgi:predicted nuclease of predicted toxin-antitoxin system